MLSPPFRVVSWIGKLVAKEDPRNHTNNRQSAAILTAIKKPLDPGIGSKVYNPIRAR